MKKYINNKGVTLIELVVVVAIIAVMTGIGGYALSMISSANAKECAKEINAALVQTRANALSSHEGAIRAPSVTIYQGTDGIYVKDSFTETPQKVGGKNVSVSYGAAGQWNPLTYSEDGEGNVIGLTFVFNRSTGGFSQCPCKNIRIAAGSKEYIITCYELTGKTILE